MNFGKIARRVNRKHREVESIESFLARDKVITQVPAEIFKELEFPIRPKGKQIPLQPDGCLQIPSYGGQ